MDSAIDNDEGLGDFILEISRVVGAGFLRNAVRESGVTCRVCATPLELNRNYVECFGCREVRLAAKRQGAGLADLVVPLFYALKGAQSGHLMHSYKTAAVTKAGVDQLGLLLSTALNLHEPCIVSAVGRPLSAWASVPSTRTPGRDHPIRRIAARSLKYTGLPEIVMFPGPGFTRTPREFLPQLWMVADQDLTGHHVLLIDDTWTTGSHAQSASAALRSAGATAVTVLVLARWLTTTWSPTQRFVRERLNEDYDILSCPVSGTRCALPGISDAPF
ncbi:hypothetical protein [Saccharopolyspora taberi]|uniref:ComF family protein n=1 Tax=Saccharopolyspora taberi TaxID=60895 RepID=A0ABN3V6L4_9PSEU